MIAGLNYAKDVQEYIDGVMSGDIVSGRLARLAVERHLQDLKTGHERGWYFDPKIAFRSVAFFPLCLRHSIGEWDNEPFYLSPWQAFCTWAIHGWRSIETKYRRFRKAHVSVARKNGKTTWMSGMALKGMYFDEPFEPGAQIYCTATKEDQAKLLYNEAARMVNRCPWLLAKSRIRKAPCSIELTAFSSIFKPLGSDSNSTDGLNPHLIVKDELHAWQERHRGLNEKLSSGGASRRQPLELIITTAGDDHSQLWLEEDDYAVRTLESVVNGHVFDDSYFAFICRLDEADDPFDERNWPKANPNYGISVKPEYLQAQALEAQNKPSVTNQFLRYHCNLRVGSHERIISSEMWKQGDHKLTIEAGAYGHGGLDLGRSNDWAAVACVFPIMTEADGVMTVERYEVLSKCWTCKDGGFNVDQEPFRGWIRDGLLECCDGNQIDFNVIKDYIFELDDKYDIRTWAYDRDAASVFWQMVLNERQLNPFEFTQAHKHYNGPMRQFVNVDLPQGKIWHGNDPVLGWQAGNLTVHVNQKDHWMPDKSQRKHKIDGMVAAIMAYSECLFAQNNKPQGSLYLTE